MLSAPRAAAAFLPLSFIKQKKMQGCLHVLQMIMLSRQVILWDKVDGVNTEELSSMRREVEAASALLFVSTVSVLDLESG